eukprot:4850726-Amphidinium_carterae.1
MHSHACTPCPCLDEVDTPRGEIVMTADNSSQGGKPKPAADHKRGRDLLADGDPFAYCMLQESMLLSAGLVVSAQCERILGSGQLLLSHGRSTSCRMTHGNHAE